MLLGGRVGILVDGPGPRRAPPSRGYRIDDNVVGGVEQGDRAAGHHRKPGAGQRVRRGGGRAGGGRRGPRHRGHRQRLPARHAAGSSTRRTWRRAGTTGRPRTPPRRPRGCEDGSASCRGGRRARRGTSEDLLRHGVELAEVERLPRAACTPPWTAASGGSPLPATPRTSRPQRSGQSAASACTNEPGRLHRGHRVRDDQIEVALPQHPESLLAGPHRLHHRALRGEQRAHHTVHRRDRRRPRGCDEGPAAPARLLLRRPVADRRVVGRQGDPELRPTLGRRLVSQLATVRLHQPVAEREPEPGSLARRLGGEERREQIAAPGAAARRAPCRTRGGSPSPSWRLVSSRIRRGRPASSSLTACTALVTRLSSTCCSS